MFETVLYRPIGVIRTPYVECAPFQAIENDDRGNFILELFPQFKGSLDKLELFSHIFIIFHMDRVKGYSGSNVAHPPNLNGKTVGLFASRSQNRPNSIGFDIARIKKIEELRIFTSGLSALDKTPLLDIKPYTSFDLKPEANNGWGNKENIQTFEQRIKNINFK